MVSRSYNGMKEALQLLGLPDCWEQSDIRVWIDTCLCHSAHWLPGLSAEFRAR